MWIIALPVCIGFLWGVEHFVRLDTQEREQALSEPPVDMKPIKKLRVVRVY